MLYEVMHAITENASLTSHESYMLIVMNMISKKDNYDKTTNTIKNIKIANTTLERKCKISRRMVYKVLASLKQKGILVSMNEREGESNNYVMIIDRIIESYPQGCTIDTPPVHNMHPSMHNMHPTGARRAPNNIYINKLINNNYKGSYFLNEQDDIEDPKEAISTQLDLLASRDELPIKYKKEDLIEEILFEVEDKAEEGIPIAKTINKCIFLVKEARWDVPTKLKVKRIAQSDARDRAWEADKAAERNDAKTTSVIARGWFEQMQRDIMQSA